jgi:hypothetical protein
VWIIVRSNILGCGNRGVEGNLMWLRLDPLGQFVQEKHTSTMNILKQSFF